MRFTGAPWWLAIAVGYVVATSTHFVLHRTVVFRREEGFQLSLAQQLPRFVAVVCCQYAVTTLAMALLPGLLGLPELLVFFAVAAVRHGRELRAAADEALPLRKRVGLGQALRRADLVEALGGLVAREPALDREAVKTSARSASSPASASGVSTDEAVVDPAHVRRRRALVVADDAPVREARVAASPSGRRSRSTVISAGLARARPPATAR